MRHLLPSTRRIAIRSLLFALSSAPVVLHGQTYFADSTQTHLAVTIPENGMDVEAADLDKDGDLDIILANEFQSNVILLNDGEGHFTNASNERFPAPRLIRDSEDIAIADFDKDGDLDIVFVSEDDFKHEYYLNDGRAYFTDVSERLPNSIANAVIASDLNGDGYPDLIIGNAGQDFALINDGTGKFVDETLQRLPAEENVTQDVELGDMDKDGDLDLVLGNEDGNKLLLNDGKGFFTDHTGERMQIGVDMETRKVAIGDVNRDGHLDIFFANVGWNQGKDPQNRIFINDGEGFFFDLTDAHYPDEVESTIDGKLADIDYDGDLDLVTANFQVRPVKVFINNGAGVFSGATTSAFSPIVTSCLGIEPADFNGDNLVDLYLCNRTHKDILLLHTGRKASVKDESSNIFIESGNHPNPFSTHTAIEYTLTRPSPVDVAIYNTLGERIATFTGVHREAGRHQVEWDAAGLPPGVYYCRVTTEEGMWALRLVKEI